MRKFIRIDLIEADLNKSAKDVKFEDADFIDFTGMMSMNETQEADMITYTQNGVTRILKERHNASDYIRSICDNGMVK